jgi:hypothetical protein
MFVDETGSNTNGYFIRLDAGEKLSERERDKKTLVFDGKLHKTFFGRNLHSD